LIAGQEVEVYAKAAIANNWPLGCHTRLVQS
jgi:hypothetical protein